MPATDTRPAITPTIDRFDVGDSGAAQAFLSAFDFLQRHAEGRYSDRTLMTVSRLSRKSEEAASGGVDSYEFGGSVLVAATEVHYDEDTEVKHGGILGVAVCIPTEQGVKAVLAVAPGARRSGVGSCLVDRLRGGFRNPTLWIGAANLVAQRFMVNQAAFPVAMNARGAIQYGWAFQEEDEGIAR